MSENVFFYRIGIWINELNLRVNSYPATRIGGGADLPLDSTSAGVRLLCDDLTLSGEAATAVAIGVGSGRHGEPMRQLNR